MGAPCAPEFLPGGQLSIQDTVHILGKVQGTGKGSIVSFCSCTLVVKCHIQLQV